MRFLIVSLFMFTLTVQAQVETLSFKNVREGKSYYSKFLNDYLVKQTLKKTNRKEIVDIYNDALKKQDPTKLCAYDLNNAIFSAFEGRASNVNFKGLVYVLRQENEIDDVVAKILLTAYEVKSTILMDKRPEGLDYPDFDENNKSYLDLIGSFEKRFSKNSCFDEAYRNYYAEFLKLNKAFKPLQLSALNSLALREKLISEKQYLELEQARVNKMHLATLSLASYQQKLKTLRIQYPLRDASERSDFSSVKVKKMNSSRRQKLFENYSDLQIIMMGNIIKKLRSRLEYDNVEMVGFKNKVVQETISLEPMERFRFAVKKLRQEMSLLALNTYFNGHAPEYIDLMTASYEIGIIPATELDTIASLETIWNPKKTFWDKAGVWIQSFSSIATIAIPPPYGFIPALAIVVIQATVGKKQNNTNEPSVLF